MSVNSNINSNIKSMITKVFEKYKSKFTKPPTTKRLSEYEKAFGFTEKTRLGSKQFSNQLGYFMEDVYNVSRVLKRRDIERQRSINRTKALQKYENERSQ